MFANNINQPTKQQSIMAGKNYILKKLLIFQEKQLPVKTPEEKNNFILRIIKNSWIKSDKRTEICNKHSTSAK